MAAIRRLHQRAVPPALFQQLEEGDDRGHEQKRIEN